MKKENNKKILFEIDGKPYFIENTEKKQVLNKTFDENKIIVENIEPSTEILNKDKTKKS